MTRFQAIGKIMGILAAECLHLSMEECQEIAEQIVDALLKAGGQID